MDTIDILYFAFGSNMYPKQMKKRIGTIPYAKRAHLPGYQFLFNKLGSDGTGKGNIVKNDKNVVWGVIFRCNQEAMNKIDDFEGVKHNHYRRKNVDVFTDDEKEFQAITYVANDEWVRSNLKPNPEYLKIILDGASHYKLPPEYITEIEKLA